MGFPHEIGNAVPNRITEAVSSLRHRLDRAAALVCRDSHGLPGPSADAGRGASSGDRFKSASGRRTDSP